MTPREGGVEVVNYVDPEEAKLPAGLVSVTDAARFLDVSDEWIRRRIASQELTMHKRRGRGSAGWRFLVETAELNKMKAKLEKVRRRNDRATLTVSDLGPAKLPGRAQS